MFNNSGAILRDALIEMGVYDVMKWFAVRFTGIAIENAVQGDVPYLEYLIYFYVESNGQILYISVNKLGGNANVIATNNQGTVATTLDGHNALYTVELIN